MGILDGRWCLGDTGTFKNILTEQTASYLSQKLSSYSYTNQCWCLVSCLRSLHNSRAFYIASPTAVTTNQADMRWTCIGSRNAVTQHLGRKCRELVIDLLIITGIPLLEVGLGKRLPLFLLINLT